MVPACKDIYFAREKWRGESDFWLDCPQKANHPQFITQEGSVVLCYNTVFLLVSDKKKIYIYINEIRLCSPQTIHPSKVALPPPPPPPRLLKSMLGRMNSRNQGRDTSRKTLLAAPVVHTLGRRGLVASRQTSDESFHREALTHFSQFNEKYPLHKKNPCPS